MFVNPFRSKTNPKTAQSQTSQKETSFLDKFFLYCAGANREIIEQHCPPAEKDKYTAIGFTVLGTAILASISGGYAIFTIFESVEIAGTIGVLWGSFIFNIDRMFVISMKKEENDKWQVFKIALPRILLGSLLGLLISKPMELRLFAKEINQVFQQEELTKISKNLKASELELTNKNKALQTELDLITKQCEDEKYRMNIELNGTGGSQKKGAGNIYEEFKKQYEDCQRKVNQEVTKSSIPNLMVTNSKQLGEISRQLALIDQQNVTKFRQNNSSFDIGSPSIFREIIILHNLAEEKSLIFVMDIFITGLFIVIELSPILAKLLTPYGSYDRALKMVEDAQKDSCKIKLQVLKSENAVKLHNRSLEIAETFWKEVGGKFKYFIPQQVLKVFNKLEEDTELVQAQEDLAKKLIDQLKNEIEKWIKNIDISQNEEK